MRPLFLASVIGLVLLPWVPTINAADSKKELEKSLQAQFKGKVFALRSSYDQKLLVYDATGTLKSAPAGHPLTVFSHVEINSLKLKKKHLEIKGRQLCSLFDPKALARSQLVRGPSVRLQVDLPEPFEASAVTGALKKIFPRPEGDKQALQLVARTAKDAQGAPIEEQKKQDVPATLDGKTIYRIKPGEVTPPECISCPDPEYPEWARKARATGIVVLWAIVSDAGEVRDLRIVRASECGLAQAAIGTVRLWRFKPGLRNGQPVPVYMTIEVTFNLI